MLVCAVVDWLFFWMLPLFSVNNFLCFGFLIILLSIVVIDYLNYLLWSSTNTAPLFLLYYYYCSSSFSFFFITLLVFYVWRKKVMVYFRGKRQTVVDTRISNQKFNAQQGNGLVQVLDLEIGKGRQEIRFLFSIIAALILASKIFCLNDYEQAITSWIKPRQ